MQNEFDKRIGRIVDGFIGKKAAVRPVEATPIKRLIGLFLLGYFLFNHPLMSLFNRPTLVWGIPLLYAYIFGIWAIMIFLAALIVGTDSRHS